jgi:alkanesulfonate monooxygenase SsuD/methylene tetrahydromethanopterin reductase-like flavin-dependent oxidoreductase (luciferase family)
VTVRVSISITDYTWPEGPAVIPQRLREVSMAADDVGIDTVWVADHLVEADPTVPDDTEMLEAFTTLDVLSEGRAWLGVGAGYQEDEATAMGLPMPPVAERFEHLEDLLRLARQMWSGGSAPFRGARHQLAAPSCDPPPVTRPHPPILVGGTGEKRTLRLVAEHADACNLFDIPDGGKTVAHKLAVLARHCEEVGRPTEIETTLSTRIGPSQSATDFVAHCTDMAGLGVDHAILLTAGGPWTGRSVEDLADIVKVLADVPGAGS